MISTPKKCGKYNCKTDAPFRASAGVGNGRTLGIARGCDPQGGTRMTEPIKPATDQDLAAILADIAREGGDCSCEQATHDCAHHTCADMLHVIARVEAEKNGLKTSRAVWGTVAREKDATIAELLGALERLDASEQAHETIHAPDGDDVARMLEYADAWANARAAILRARGGKPEDATDAR